MARSYERKDHLYKLAKQEGYRSRAAYKLIELDQKYQIVNVGERILDLGSWPGGWLQVAAELTGREGLVVGVDLVEIDPLPFEQIKFVSGDVCDDDVIKRLLEISGEKYDVVLSDMSPKLTGIKEADAAGVVGLAELAVFVAERTLRADGSFVVKLFKTGETERFFRSLRPLFAKLFRTELKSSRGSSNEFYCIGLGFKR